MVSWATVAALAAVLVVRFTPEYSLHSSYLLTSAALVSITWVASFIYNCILYPTYFTPLRHIPTPPNRSWLYGNTGTFKLQFPIEKSREWAKTVPNNGLIRYYIVTNRERVLVVSPKAISDLLVHKSYDFARPEIARVRLESVTGDGLLVAEGDVHKFQRKNLMPSFSYRHIKDLHPIFWSKAIQMTNAIDKDLKSGKPDSNTIQIKTWSQRAMLDIIGLAGINYDFNAVKDPDNELSRRYASLGSGGDVSVLQALLAVIFVFFIGVRWFQYVPTRQNRTTLDGVKYIRDVAHKHVSEKRVRMQQQENEEGEENTAIDILSVAMRSGSFSDSNLVDQMMTFLGAGHETTSTAFQWSIYALSKHPEMQTRLRKDIREVLPAIPFDELDDDIEHIKNIKDKLSNLLSIVDSNNNNHSLPYLWAFTNEVLRFYPSVPFTSREAIRDTTLAGQHIPRGTTVLISPDMTNRDEDLWGADAGTFNPDRWLDRNSLAFNNNGGAENNYANLTFMHGPRSCIGQGFAKAELAIFVAVFVYRFEFELSEPEKELKVRREITQAPADGVVVKVREVECLQ